MECENIVINAVPCDAGRSNISQHYDLFFVSDDIFLASKWQTGKSGNDQFVCT